MRAIYYEKKWKSYSADLICYPLISANKITLKLWSIESPVAARLKRPLHIGRTSRVKQKWSKLRDFMMNDAGFTWSKRKSKSEKKNQEIQFVVLNLNHDFIYKTDGCSHEMQSLWPCLTGYLSQKDHKNLLILLINVPARNACKTIQSVSNLKCCKWGIIQLGWEDFVSETCRCSFSRI